jgi:putative membrane protein
MKIYWAVLFLLLQPALAQAQCGWGYMGGWGFMMFFWLVILGLIFYVIYARGRNRDGGPGARPGGKALEILKERYARGEISREEFERMKKDIE